MLIISVLAIIILSVLLAISTLWVKISTIKLESDTVGFKVIHLTDIHGRVSFLNGSLSHMVNRLNPDCVVITGDLATRRRQFSKVLKEIKSIQCSRIYFVPGNYERECMAGIRKRQLTEIEFLEIISELQQINVEVLVNEGRQLEIDNSKTLIYGFDNSIYGNEQLTMREEDYNSNDGVILLAHSPSIINYIQKNGLSFDLLLTGHTHGGQIRVLTKTIGAYKNYHVGLKRISEHENVGGRSARKGYFYINRGLGTVKLPVRIGCMPEIAVFEFSSNNK